MLLFPFLCSDYVISLVVSTVNRWMLIYLWKFCVFLIFTISSSTHLYRSQVQAGLLQKPVFVTLLFSRTSPQKQLFLQSTHLSIRVVNTDIQAIQAKLKKRILVCEQYADIIGMIIHYSLYNFSNLIWRRRFYPVSPLNRYRIISPSIYKSHVKQYC